MSVDILTAQYENCFSWVELLMKPPEKTEEAVICHISHSNFKNALENSGLLIILNICNPF